MPEIDTQEYESLELPESAAKAAADFDSRAGIICNDIEMLRKVVQQENDDITESGGRFPTFFGLPVRELDEVPRGQAWLITQDGTVIKKFNLRRYLNR